MGRNCQTQTERRLKVSYKWDGRNTSHPKVLLSGQWLRELGFETGEFVKLTVSDGKIIIEKE